MKMRNGFYRSCLATFLIISIWFLCVANGDECPPPEALYPCHCESPPYPVVRCINLTKMETINEIFQQSGDLRFKFFVLENSTLMFLPASSLVSKRFYGLMIINTKLIGLFDTVPSSSNTIVVFTLQNVVIQRGIKWEHFQKFTKIVNLQFIKIQIKTLGKEFSKNIPSGLSHLSLIDTNTAKLADGVFERLNKIFAFFITNNRIKVLKRNMFSRPCPVRNFAFEGNLIESLPNDIFSDMPFLKFVGFQNNRISILKESVFEPVFSQLVILNVNKNPIQCDCTIAWLTRSNSKKVMGFCGEPSFKKGVEIKTLTEEDFKYCQD